MPPLFSLLLAIGGPILVGVGLVVLIGADERKSEKDRALPGDGAK